MLFKNVAMHVVPEFVRQHGFNLVGAVIVEQRVGENDAPGRAQAGQSGVGLLAFLRKLPAVDAADAVPARSLSTTRRRRSSSLSSGSNL